MSDPPNIKYFALSSRGYATFLPCKKTALFLGDRTFYDMTVKTAKQSFHLHKAVMSSYALYFRDLIHVRRRELAGAADEKDNTELYELPDTMRTMPAALIELFFCYPYHYKMNELAKTELRIDDYKKLYEIGVLMQCPTFMELVSETLQKHLHDRYEVAGENDWQLLQGAILLQQYDASPRALKAFALFCSRLPTLFEDKNRRFIHGRQLSHILDHYYQLTQHVKMVVDTAGIIRHENTGANGQQSCIRVGDGTR
jgi:hypothetical protein